MRVPPGIRALLPALALLGATVARAHVIDVPVFPTGGFAPFGASVAGRDDGGFVVGWGQYVNATDSGAFTRAFSATGAPLGPIERIDATGRVSQVALDAAPDGGFFSAWLRRPPSGKVWELFGRRLAADGSGLAAPFGISIDDSFIDRPSVAALTNGVAFAWQQNGRFRGRVFDDAGFPRTVDFEIGQFAYRHDVVALPDGGFFAAWWNLGPPGLSAGRVFDALGTPRGDAFALSDEFVPTAVAATAAGDVVVVGIGQQGSSEPNAIWLRRFASDGTPVRDAIVVQPAAEGESFVPDVALDVQGNAWVVWRGYNSNPGVALPPRGRGLDATDAPLGPAIDLDSGGAYAAATARLADGRFANVWTVGNELRADVVSLCTPAIATCGDGILHAQCEQCDAGALNSDTTPDACRTDCTLATCGDGTVDGGEACDDGNRTSCDGCSRECVAEPGIVCGDGIPEPSCGQMCDDANAVIGDFCGAACELERIRGGGKPATDCIVEWQVNNPGNLPLLDKRGGFNSQQRCLDDDPACDFDGGVAGSCTFRVRACANNTDVPGCAPRSRLAAWELRTPNASQAAKSPVLAAVRDALATIPGTIVGPSAHDLCSGDVEVTVPLRGSAAVPHPGKLKLIDVARTYDDATDKDTLRLICLPR